jgi:cytidylate kinase
MYRSIALAALEGGIPLDSEEEVAALARRSVIEFVHAKDAPIPTATLLDGKDVTSAIRTPTVDEAVSSVARLPRVRDAMVAQQRRIAQRADAIVLEGRDIGTVVFPGAEVKVFLTASPQERSRRRYSEMAEHGHEVAEETVFTNIERRDHADSSRETAPLAPAPDAVIVDTTGMSVTEVVDEVVRLVERVC